MFIRWTDLRLDRQSVGWMDERTEGRLKVVYKFI